jgi:hypothetical protein
MRFVKDFLRNLGLILLLGVVLFVVAPDTMRQIVDLIGALLEKGKRA